MVDQTSVDHQRNGKSASQGVQRSVSALAHDLITLVELQVQLLAYDVGRSKSRLVASAVLFVIAGVLALGAVPVLLLACGAGIQAAWPTMPIWAAILIPAVVALVVGAALGWLGYSKVQGAVGAFARSRDELVENVQSVKAALKRSG